MKAAFLFLAVVIVVVSGQEECERPCQMNFDPVCATFTKTYSNECMMKADACNLAQQGIHLLAHTDTVCSCDRPCPFNMSPVCATDGNTYDNECMMGVAACKARKWMEVKSTGQCPPSN